MVLTSLWPSALLSVGVRIVVAAVARNGCVNGIDGCGRGVHAAFTTAARSFGERTTPSNSPGRRRGGGESGGGEGMGKHRRISAAPASPSVNSSLPAAVRCWSRRTSKDTAFSPLAALLPVSLGARSRRPRLKRPSRPSGLRGVAVGPLWPRRPFFPRKGRNGQLTLAGLYIRDSHAGATQLSWRDTAHSLCHVPGLIAVGRACPRSQRTVEDESVRPQRKAHA
jgi:hypothetical protein